MTELKSTREGFGAAIWELASSTPNLMVLSADLSDSLQLTQFKRDFPSRYLECGISEQNMIGVAAGLAMLGKTVVATSFASFNPGRDWEQIRVAICQQNLDVKIVGSHAGLATGPDGGTHQSLEDIALMSVLPQMKVIAPSDYTEAKLATAAMLRQRGPTYLRLSRAQSTALPPPMGGEPQFAFGKGQVLRVGKDIYIVAYGLITELALSAVQNLPKTLQKRIGIINMSSIKPFDEKLLLAITKKCRGLIIAEEHQLIGGLGSQIAQFLSLHQPTPLEFVAVDGRFGQSGTKDELFTEYGLTEIAIRDKIEKLLLR